LDLSKLDLLVIQIDGLHIGNDLVLVAALGIDGEGHKHPLALIEGATENTAVVQALIDNLIERGLDPKVCRLFIIDGAKALSKVIRRTFGAHARSVPAGTCNRRPPRASDSCNDRLSG
jgi:putative transposase